jgi:hypothetical protein
VGPEIGAALDRAGHQRGPKSLAKRSDTSGRNTRSRKLQLISRFR